MSQQADRLNTALTGRYRIERELGTGGMATVYLAEDLKHDRKVAIKVLKPELAAVLGAERFVVEIKTTAAMSHPHILPLFDSGTADGFLFYVMPYIEGETIRDKLNRETQFGVDEAVRIAREVADALDYAHRHGIIHRDIKPENILLHDGRAMVMDFGIALAVSAAAGGRMTETGLSLGTPHYMSPEQATAEKEITARADQYSLASVLYEMLTGNPPHTGAAAQQIIMKIITETAEPVTKYRKAVPANVAATVAKALEKLPADRFESAKAFADALGNIGFTNATMAIRDARAAGAGVFRSTPFTVAASIALVATVAAAWGWWRPAPPREIARFSLFFPDSQALAESSNAYRATLSPDGRTIVYAGACSCAGATQLWIRPLEQLRAVPIPGTEGGMNPSFSPDGKNIVFTYVGGRRSIKRVSLSGGPALMLTDSLVDLGGATWAADGFVYYDGKLEGDGVARVKETGGKPEIATTPDSAAGETYHFVPSALPEGRGVLFVITRSGNPAAADIAVLDSRTHKHKVLTRGIHAQYVAPGYLVYVTDGGSLMAVPFDLDELALNGEAVALAGGVSVRGNLRVDLAVSGTGSAIYAAGTSIASRRELVWVSRDGTAVPVDRDWSGEGAGRPALSPDGRTVAVATGSIGARQLWVKQLDRGPASKIADGNGLPAWSPDGKSIIYGSTTGIWRVPADGSVLPAEVWKFESGAGAVSFTADGKWVLFQSRGDLYVVQTAGDTTARLLVADQGTQSSAQVSPDGKWVAYQSDESGSPQVYVRPFPDTKVAKRQISTGAGGALPKWSRDGRELFYVDIQTGDVTSVPVIPGAAFTTGVPARLFPYAPYLPSQSLPFDVSPDGKRFLFSRGVGTEVQKPDELVLVQNFVEELKAKVKPK